MREAAARLGYTPSAAARVLRSGRSDLVLCVLPDWPVGPMIDTLLDELTHSLAERQLSVLVHHARGPRPLADLWRAVTPRAVIGFASVTDEDEESLRRAGITVVRTAIDEDPHHPRVYAVSQARIGRLQVDHLLARGHQRLGYAAPDEPRVSDFATGRLAGVRAACEEHGLPEPVVVPVAVDPTSGAEAVRRWTGAGSPVTAVAAYNDEVALAVLAGVRAAGLRCPEDLAVIGVDDIAAAALAAPPLTSVAQSPETQARYLAAEVVAALDDAEDSEPPVRPDPADVLSVVVRSST